MPKNSFMKLFYKNRTCAQMYNNYIYMSRAAVALIIWSLSRRAST